MVREALLCDRDSQKRCNLYEFWDEKKCSCVPRPYCRQSCPRGQFRHPAEKCACVRDLRAVIPADSVRSARRGECEYRYRDGWYRNRKAQLLLQFDYCAPWTCAAGLRFNRELCSCLPDPDYKPAEAGSDGEAVETPGGKAEREQARQMKEYFDELMGLETEIDELTKKLEELRGKRKLLVDKIAQYEEAMRIIERHNVAEEEVPYELYTDACKERQECPELQAESKQLGMELPVLLQVVQAPRKEEAEIATLQLAVSDKRIQRSQGGIRAKRYARTATATRAGRAMQTADGPPVRALVNTCDAKQEENTMGCSRSSMRCARSSNVVACVNGTTRCIMDANVRYQICKT